MRSGLLVVVGYILSPLSWWNDAFVNLPLAYAFALLGGLISAELFVPALIAGYWLTNIAGLLMLHYGLIGTPLEERQQYGWREAGKDLLISLCYTAALALLAWHGWIAFPAGHLPRPPN